MKKKLDFKIYGPLRGGIKTPLRRTDTRGKVKVNGKVITEMGVLVSDKDRIEVNGIPIKKKI